MTSKRGNGEGTICRRKKGGTFEGAVSVLTVGGGRKRVHFYGKTEQEVQEKLTAAKMQSQQGIPVPDRSWKVDEYLDYWLEHAVRIKRRPNTYSRHETVVRLYLKPGLGTHVLQHLSVRTVQDFLDGLYANNNSISQIDHARRVLSAALTYAVRQELVMRNVAHSVELPAYKPNEAKHWNASEVAQFLEVAQSDPLYPAFVLVVLYGLRRGEVLGLRWCDVDLEQGVLRIRQQIQRIDGRLQQVPLKTQSSEGDEPLLEAARGVLRAQLAKQAAMRATAREQWQGAGTDEELVFTTRTGMPIDPRNLNRSFERIREQHGIRHITLHGLRHTNATIQKNLNVHARDIQAILRHGDVRTTGIYEHVDMDSKRSALEKVEQRVFKAEAVFSAGSNRDECRNLLSYDHNFAVESPSFISGSRGGIRTRDPRLMRPHRTSVHERLQSVTDTMKARTRSWRSGVVVVSAVVRTEQFLAGELASGSMFALGPSSPQVVLGKVGLLDAAPEPAGISQ